MTPRRVVLLAPALLALISLTAGPGVAPGVADVRMRTRTITAEAAIAAPPAATAPMTTVVVAAALRVTPEWRQAVEALGARLVTYLPERAFLVRVPGERLAALGAIPGTDFVAAYLPGDKLAPELAPVAAAKAGARFPIHVLVAPDAPSARVADALRSLGLEVAGAGDGGVFNDVVAFLPAERLDLAARIAELPDVLWIEPQARRVLLNDLSYWVDQGGIATPYVTPIFDHGIYGAGQTVAVLDTGLDYDMCYFHDPAGTPPTNQNGATALDPSQRKVVAYDFLWDQDDPADPEDYDDHSHGTHVAGSVAGDDDAHLLGHDLGDGMAPAAKLVIQDGGYAVNDCADLPGIGCPVVDLTPIYDQAYQQGARFHSNSWGDQENATPQNNYTAACVDTDDFMFTHPDFLILYAAGNGGPGNDTVGSPSVAKSTVSVGATLRGTVSDALAGFSSRGSAADGRLKPTITAPGSNIRSALTDGDIGTGNCGTASFSGTSMACPTAAGLAALVAEYYKAGYYPGGVRGRGPGLTPSAALVKATLVNSGRTMTMQAVIPSRDQGWGRITLADTLAFPGGPRDLAVVDEKTGFPTGATTRRRIAVEVRSNAVPLKATLVWTDPPSNPIAATNLINDLDLMVSGPAGTFRGNVFSGGVSVTGGTADRRNVEEQVLIASPAPGMYDIDVTPFAVPSGPQPFALVVTGDLMTPFHLVYAGMTIVSEANGNGWIDPAEAIRLGFALRNSSDYEDALQITGSLTSRSPDVTVTDATASWPNIAAGASAQSLADHFAIQVAPTVTCGARVPMQLDVNAGVGHRVILDFTLLVGGYVDHLVERFDTTPVGQLPAGFTVTSDNDPFGVAMCDDSVEPTATSPGPTSAPNALFIGKSGTDTQRTSTLAVRSLALGPFAGRPAALSFRWWSYDPEGGDRLVAALSPGDPTVFRWELMRTSTDYESMTTGGGLWGTTTVDLDAIPVLAGIDTLLRFDASTSLSEVAAGGGAGDGFYIDDLVLRTVQCSAACAASTVTPNSLRAVKIVAAVRVSWSGAPSGFNLHETTVPADLPSLWNGTPLNPAPLPTPSFDVTTPLSPLALYRAFGADCTGASVP